MPRTPADVTETRKMVSGYYGRLLWQPQVSVRASISHSVGEKEREREKERGEERRTRREEKSTEEVRCGNKQCIGTKRGKREEQMQRRKKRRGVSKRKK